VEEKADAAKLVLLNRFTWSASWTTPRGMSSMNMSVPFDTLRRMR